MKIAICDDEIFFAQHLETLVNEFAKEEKIPVSVCVFTSAEDFLKSKLDSYNIVFLDVLIEGTNGMDAARTFREVNSTAVLVFVSAFSEFAPEGFEVNAFRYLLKNDLAINFPECMTKAMAKASAQTRIFQLKSTESEPRNVLLNDILFFESTDHSIYVRLLDAKYKIYDTLVNIEAQVISVDFVRAQRSYIVNLRNVIGMHCCEITLVNGEKITCNRQARKDIQRRFLEIQGE